MDIIIVTINFQKNMNSDVISFTPGCLPLPSSLERTEFLIQKQHERGGTVWQGRAGNHCSKNWELRLQSELPYAPARAHTHHPQHSPSPISRGQMDKQKVSWNCYYQLGKLIRIIPLTLIRNGQVPPSPHIGQLGQFYFAYHFQTPRISCQLTAHSPTGHIINLKAMQFCIFTMEFLCDGKIFTTVY